MLKFILDKPGREITIEVVEDVSSSEEEEGSKKKMPKKKKSSVTEPLPFQLTLDEKLICKLVFLDLTHPDLIAWEKQQFSSFLAIVRELSVTTEFVIVSVMEFGQQLVNFTLAWKDMKDARVLLKCGAYEGDKIKREVELSYPCWQLVYFFVILDPEDYKPLIVENPKLQPFIVEFEPKNADVEFQVKEGDGAKPTNIKMKAPRWEFVVLDFFSGGVFAREALMMARDVIYFPDSEPEAEFVDKFSKELMRYNERVKKWFSRYKVTKKPAATSQPASSSQPVSTSQAALTSQPSSSSHTAEQSKDDQLANVEDPSSSFVLDDLLVTDALERLGNVRKAGFDFGDTI
ncbi:hypothetical protein R1sor_024205 [Riccia sorocarpa]|uniref:Uncharacterized protein n=1 Tax=Riccia sorocarpa TaxID=122646 RepID=A0ABD3GTU9_9MARC